MEKYEDSDWDEIPKEDQATLAVLGWTKKIWDKDGEPDTEDLDWDELTPAQQAAATKMGYTKEKWDSDE